MCALWYTLIAQRCLWSFCKKESVQKSSGHRQPVDQQPIEGQSERGSISKAVRILGLKPVTLVAKLVEFLVGRGNICLEGL